MIDLEKHIIALKCTWVRRLLRGDHVWGDLFKKQYGNILSLTT